MKKYYKSLLSVVILWFFSCGAKQNLAETSQEKPTEVVVIGTFHGMHYSMSEFHPDALRELMGRANPDIIAAEIRPQDYAAKNWEKTPTDMSRIVIPFAAQNNIPVFPIDWWEDDVREQAQKLYSNLQKTEEGKKKLESVPDEMAPHRELFADLDRISVSYVQSDAFATADHEIRLQTTKIMGEGPGNLFWNTRSQKMNKLLLGVIEKNPGKRIVVLTGAAHRFDFEIFLSHLKGVRLIRSQQFTSTPFSSYSGKEAPSDEIRRMLFARVQGPKANTNPDAVETEKVEHLLKIAKEKSKGTQIWIDYTSAELAYLKKDYSAALVGFSAAQLAPKEEKVFGFPMATIASFRRANMYDLLGERKKALDIYSTLNENENLKGIVGRFLKTPFQRPVK